MIGWLHDYAGLVLLAALAIVFVTVGRREIRDWFLGVQADVSAYRDLNRGIR